MSKLFQGRIGRAMFFSGVIGASLFLVGIQVVGVRYSATISTLVHNLIFILVSIFLIALMLSLYIRRLHDVGRTGWWSLLIFMPFVNLFFFVYLVGKKGDKKENKYGAPSQIALV